MLADKLSELGAKMEFSSDANRGACVMDERLLTGENSNSAQEFAQKIADLLWRLKGKTKEE